MSSVKIFLDFDETLFNHHAYMEWASDLLEAYGAQPGSYKASVNEFHTQIDETLRLYRHEEHIMSVSQRPWSYISGEIHRAIAEGCHDFCYSDVHRFLKNVTEKHNDVRILTYGNGEYQRYKINLCPVISGLKIPVHVVNEPKRQFLADNFTSANGVLLDDKYPLQLPSNWQHIWINRKSNLKKPEYIQETNVVQISRLSQFFDALNLTSESLPT